MDLIYSGAHVTIVTAAADDPSYGLFRSIGPFIKSSSRNSSEFEPFGFFNPGDIIPTVYRDYIRGVEREIFDSKWFSRGWTYQEGILSPRLLIFTKSHLYFECKNMQTGRSARDNKYASSEYKSTTGRSIFSWNPTGWNGKAPIPLGDYASHQ
jgi:hypothetical protein